MQRVEHRALTLKEPWMLGRKVAIDDDANLIGEELDRRRSAHVARRNRIAIGTAAYFGEFRDACLLVDTRAWENRRKRPQRSTFDLQMGGDHLSNNDATFAVGATERQEVFVKRFQQRGAAERSKEVVLDVPVHALDAALLVTLPRRRELHL